LTADGRELREPGRLGLGLLRTFGASGHPVLSGKRSLGLADRVPRNAASTDGNLSAVPAEQLPSLPDLVTSNHR
jgi:hypothetical protein